MPGVQGAANYCGILGIDQSLPADNGVHPLPFWIERSGLSRQVQIAAPRRLRLFRRGLVLKNVGGLGIQLIRVEFVYQLVPRVSFGCPFRRCLGID
jgi:hypothetical protein